MRHLILGSILALGALGFAGGCGGLVGDNITKYERNSQPLPPTEAPSDGTYGLFYSTDANPQIQYPLMKGDKLGFMERDSKIYGIAGTNEVPIQTTALVRTVYWRRLKK